MLPRTFSQGFYLSGANAYVSTEDDELSIPMFGLLRGVAGLFSLSSSSGQSLESPLMTPLRGQPSPPPLGLPRVEVVEFSPALPGLRQACRVAATSSLARAGALRPGYL